MGPNFCQGSETKLAKFQNNNESNGKVGNLMNDAENRRKRSYSKLSAKDVPFIEHLPTIETEQESFRRKAEEVGLRIICLALVSMKGANADYEFIKQGADHYEVWDDFSPEEKAFILDPNSDEHTKIQFSWRAEAAHALLWSIYKEKALGHPNKPCDWNAFWTLMQENDKAEFLSDISLRPQNEILDEADLIYRFHWTARDAVLNNREIPADLNTSVIMERHYALNWLILPNDDDSGPIDWDDVPTDT